MAKDSIRDFSATAGSNTDIQSVNIDENCPASGINNAIRELMVDLKNVSTGAVNLETPAADQLNVDNIRIDGNTISSTDTNGDITLDPDGTGDTVIASGFVGIGESTPRKMVHITKNDSDGVIILDADGATTDHQIVFSKDYGTGGTTGGNYWGIGVDGSENRLVFAYDANSQASLAADSKMILDSNGNVLFDKTNDTLTVSGSAFVNASGHHYLNVVHDVSDTNSACIYVNRQNTDGRLMDFRHANSTEGTISVSGSTVSYNGGHLSRWSRLADNIKPPTLLKGTVLTNLDEMIVWSHDEVLWSEDDELPKGVSVGDVKTAAYTEDNEQLNHTAISSVEGDANVAGLFVSWDVEDGYNDFYLAMTGDMVIRIAQGTTVARGDLLMSAGDGTAKPQGDDIVRSKTIAKVTSTTVSHTYDDGTFLVPCVLMAC